MTKYDTLQTVANVCEFRHIDFEHRARDLIALLEHERFCDADQDFFRPIHDPWARTYIAKLAELYQDIAGMFDELAEEAIRVADED